MELLEPLFWLHHAVSTSGVCCLSWTLITNKMTDKIWTDWQNKDKRNANAFQAGTIQALANVSYFNQWPTGAPPWLQVCDLRLLLTRCLTHLQAKCHDAQ